jgi:Methyltransferase domain
MRLIPKIKSFVERSEQHSMELTPLYLLFQEFGTDKVEYAPAYETFFGSRRTEVTRVLEIGIGTMLPKAPFSMSEWGADWYRPGGSLRAWKAYFPNAHIYGIDIQPDTQFSEDRISTFLCNSTDAEKVSELMASLERKHFDLVIDDGSHAAEDQLQTLKNFFGHVAPKGVYVIEDVAGNGIWQRHQEILQLVGDEPMFSFNTKADLHNPIFILRS